MSWLRFYWMPLGRPALFACAACLLASIGNYSGGFEFGLVAFLVGAGLVLAGMLERTSTRPPGEYLNQLPLARAQSLWSPYATGSALLLVLSAVVHLHESAGIAYYELRSLMRVLGIDPSELEWFRRPLGVSLRFFVYPQLAFFGATYLFHAARRYAPEQGWPLWFFRPIAYTLTSGALLLFALTWIKRPQAELLAPTFGLIGFESVPMALICLYCAHVVRARLVEGDLERLEVKEQSWDF